MLNHLTRSVRAFNTSGHALLETSRRPRASIILPVHLFLISFSGSSPSPWLVNWDAPKQGSVFWPYLISICIHSPGDLIQSLGFPWQGCVHNPHICVSSADVFPELHTLLSGCTLPLSTQLRSMANLTYPKLGFLSPSLFLVIPISSLGTCILSLPQSKSLGVVHGRAHLTGLHPVHLRILSFFHLNISTVQLLVSISTSASPVIVVAFPQKSQASASGSLQCFVSPAARAICSHGRLDVSLWKVPQNLSELSQARLLVHV